MEIRVPSDPPSPGEYRVNCGFINRRTIGTFARCRSTPHWGSTREQPLRLHASWGRLAHQQWAESKQVEPLLSSTRYQPREQIPELVLRITADRKTDFQRRWRWPKDELKLDDLFDASWSRWSEGILSGRSCSIPFLKCLFFSHFGLKTWKVAAIKLLSLRIKTSASFLSDPLNKNFCEYQRLAGEKEQRKC